MRDEFLDPGLGNEVEEAVEAGLRPRHLDEFVGQRELKEHLHIVLEAARRRGQAVDHLLFAGPPGLGKTTLAGIAAVGLGIRTLMIGALSTDGAHADGRADFINAVSRLMALQEGGIEVVAPAIGMTATELVEASGVPREVLAWAHSCHVGNLACGRCRGCVKHYRTWKALGWDPH